MPSLICGCYGKSVRSYETSVQKMVRRLSSEGQYQFEEIRCSEMILGIVQNDLAVRSRYYPADNLTIAINGFVYGSVRMEFGSDLDIVFDAYKTWGDNMSDNVYGPFILFIYDHKNDELKIINDVYGLQPMFFTKRSEHIFFATEGESIIRADIIPPKLDCDSLAELFLFGYIIGESTLLCDVKRLIGGSVLTVGPAGFNIRHKRIKYRSGVAGAKVKHWCSNFRNSMNASMRRISKYMQSDIGGVVLNLSGGIDSRVLLCSLMDLGVDFEARTEIVYGEENEADINYAMALQKRFGFKHNIIQDKIHWHTMYKTMLATSRLIDDQKITGHGGELIRGKWRKHLEYYTDEEADDKLRHYFKKGFMSKLSKWPNDTMRNELSAVNIDCPDSRLEVVYLLNTSSFFRKSYPSVHRFYSIIIRGIHMPFFDKDFIEVIMDIPYAQRRNNRFVLKYFDRLYPEYMELPCTAIEFMDPEVARRDALHYTINHKQYCRYSEELRKSSTLWNMDIFNESINGKDDVAHLCFFNIWHDQYLGNGEAVNRLISIENELVNSVLSL